MNIPEKSLLVLRAKQKEIELKQRDLQETLILVLMTLGLDETKAWNVDLQTGVVSLKSETPEAHV